MPLSEFYRMVQGQLESAQQKTTTRSTDLSFVPDSELVELVWENGQIMMQGQSSKGRRSPTFSTFPSQTPTFGDKEDGSVVTNPRMLKFGATDNVPNNFPTSVPPVDLGLGQVDDLVPWLNYAIDDPLQHDYCPDFLPELSGVTVNEISAQNSLASINKRNNCSQTAHNSYNFPVNNGVGLERGNVSKVASSGGGELTRSRSGQLYPLSSPQGQTSALSLGSGASDNIGNNSSNTHQAVCVDSVRCHASAGGFPSMKTKRQDSGLPNTSSGFTNFSHFTRPAAFVRANLQNIGAMDTLGSSEIERMGSKNTDSAPSSSNPAESIFINSSTGPRKEMGFDTQTNLAPGKVDLKPLMDKPIEKLRPTEQSEAVCQGDPIKNDKSPNQVLGASTTKEMPDGEKTVEPVVGSSSVCSGNSVERASNDPTHNLKRRCHETDDSECRSEDVEEESVGVRKPGPARGGTGSKRSRAAEVHNLSERRRRDRINEKMRALQELIPNCNKVDKASMLDEAIDYLKTLQLQVQIMSMGAGLYMQPMMIPPGMQHVHAAAHMTHFSPMGVGMGMGMGMGMGYGMGMLDMNGGSPRCPMIQVPSMQGAHYPVPPISGPSNLQGMAGQVFGHPGQGFPMTMPRAPLGPLSGGPPINSAMRPNVSWMAAIPVDVPNSGSKSSSKIQNTNSQMMHNTDASSSMKTSSQCQTTNEGFEQSAAVLKNDRAPEVSSSEAVN